MQIAEISRYGFNLRLVQVMCDRLHDGRCVWICSILTALFVPIGQYLYDVGIDLTCEARKGPITLGLGTVTTGTGRNIGVGNSLFKDLLSSWS